MTFDSAQSPFRLSWCCKSQLWIFALLLAAFMPALADSQSTYVARTGGPDTPVTIVYFDGVREIPVDHVSLRNVYWCPWNLRNRSVPGQTETPNVHEIEGNLPRLQVRSDFQLFAFRSLSSHPTKPSLPVSSGIGVISPDGVDVIIRHARAMVLDSEGAFLGPDGDYLAVAGEDAFGDTLYVIDLTLFQPEVAKLTLPSSSWKIEHRSLVGTKRAVFFSAKNETGDSTVLRATFTLPLNSAREIAAEPVSAHFNEVQRYFAYSTRAIGFLAGDHDDKLAVFVALQDGGPAINVTNTFEDYAKHRPEDPKLSVSDDGARVAYNLDEGNDLELFVHEVSTPGPEGRRQITADERFNPYIDQESWIFFNRNGGLVFAGGHDSSSTDLFVLDPDLNLSSIRNLTRTGSGLLPPFFTTGTLEIDAMLMIGEETAVTSASGLIDGEGTGITGVSMSTGESLFEVPGWGGIHQPFSIGVAVHCFATNPEGQGAVVRFSEDRFEEVLVSPLHGAPGPALLIAESDRAIVHVPGVGIVSLGASSEPRTLLTDSPNLRSLTAAPNGKTLLYVRGPADPSPGVYALDTVSGEEQLYYDGVEVGDLLSVAFAVEPFLRGDSNRNSAHGIEDALHTLFFLFLGTTRITCPDAADFNDDGVLDVTDPLVTLNYLFLAGPSPLPPGEIEGFDPTPDGLDPCQAK